MFPYPFLTSYIAAGLCAILLCYFEAKLTLARPCGRCLSYHSALSSIVTISTTHKPLPGVVTIRFLAGLAVLSSWR